jgi:hypothetical protein
MAIHTGVFVSDMIVAAASILGMPSTAAAAAALFLGGILMPSLVRDVELNRLLLRVDFGATVDYGPFSPGTVLAATQGVYGKPQLPFVYRIVQMNDFGSLRTKHIRWVLSDSLDQLAFSPGPSDSQLAELRVQAFWSSILIQCAPVLRSCPYSMQPTPSTLRSETLRAWTGQAPESASGN